MSHKLIVAGAPSSAGAYAPGQEKAPAALRNAGLLDMLHRNHLRAEDAGDVSRLCLRCRFCPWSHACAAVKR